jgi:hypothetical protein
MTEDLEEEEEGLEEGAGVEEGALEEEAAWEGDDAAEEARDPAFALLIASRGRFFDTAEESDFDAAAAAGGGFDTNDVDGVTGLLGFDNALIATAIGIGLPLRFALIAAAAGTGTRTLLELGFLGGPMDTI